MKRSFGTVLASMALGLFTACGGGGGKEMDPPITNLSGDWEVTLIRDQADNDCSNDTWNHGTFDIDLTVTHTADSNDFTFTVPLLSTSAAGTIDGDHMVFGATGTPPAFCDTLQVDVDLTVDDGGGPTTAAGTAHWVCTNGNGTCSGTDEVHATRPVI